jgi:hypothetical protein
MLLRVISTGGGNVGKSHIRFLRSLAPSRKSHLPTLVNPLSNDKGGHQAKRLPAMD